MIRTASISAYLMAPPSSLCLEVARQPRLLPVFFAILRLVPRTVAALEQQRRRVAA